jgi:catechol 2,3-dioxygenase-like lactoylglutathione lyase family enzyme
MKLNHIDLPVADIAGVRAFFESHFGFRCIFEREDDLPVLLDDGEDQRFSDQHERSPGSGCGSSVGLPGHENSRAGERLSKGGFAASSPADKRDYVRHCRPCGLSVAKGCVPTSYVVERNILLSGGSNED